MMETLKNVMTKMRVSVKIDFSQYLLAVLCNNKVWYFFFENINIPVYARNSQIVPYNIYYSRRERYITDCIYRVFLHQGYFILKI